MSRCCSIYSSFRQKQLNFLLYRQSGEIQEKRILKKWKILLEISSFYMCTKNHNNLMYSSWDTEWDGQNFLSFSAIFWPFYPPKQPGKSKFWKNEKSTWRCHHFTCVPKMTILWCMILEIWSATDSIFCHLGPFFAPFFALTTQKIKTLEKWKKAYYLTKACLKSSHMLYCS